MRNLKPQGRKLRSMHMLQTWKQVWTSRILLDSLHQLFQSSRLFSRLHTVTETKNKKWSRPQSVRTPSRPSKLRWALLPCSITQKMMLLAKPKVVQGLLTPWRFYNSSLHLHCSRILVIQNREPLHQYLLKYIQVLSYPCSWICILKLASMLQDWECSSTQMICYSDILALGAEPQCWNWALYRLHRGIERSKHWLPCFRSRTIVWVSPPRLRWHCKSSLISFMLIALHVKTVWLF